MNPQNAAAMMKEFPALIEAFGRLQQIGTRVEPCNMESLSLQLKNLRDNLKENWPIVLSHEPQRVTAPARTETSGSAAARAYVVGVISAFKRDKPHLPWDDVVIDIYHTAIQLVAKLPAPRGLSDTTIRALAEQSYLGSYSGLMTRSLIAWTLRELELAHNPKLFTDFNKAMIWHEDFKDGGNPWEPVLALAERGIFIAGLPTYGPITVYVDPVRRQMDFTDLAAVGQLTID